MRIAVALLAAIVFAAGLRWGTFAVGGSDSYCYVHQAEQWASGRLQVVEPLALAAPWPDGPLTFAPAGHIPSPTLRGAAAPMCPPGLSIAMAPGLDAGAVLRRPDLVFAVVPLFGALLIAATYMLGSRYGKRVGLASALLVACSPVFLFQLMQPMSDVPATAIWILAIACATGPGRRAPLAAGLATGAAILVRPNLLPMGLALGLFILLHGARIRPGSSVESGFSRTFWRERTGDAAMFAAACAPGCIAVGIIQQIFYGSPLQSGYGSLGDLFAVSHVGPNAVRYVSWFSQTHTPAWLIALAAPLLLPGWLTSMLLTLAAVNVACYLPYVVFNDWWYLRFLLPAVAMVMILFVATLDALVGRMPSSGRSGETAQSTARRAIVVGAVTLVLCGLFVRDARARSVFDLGRLESRYVRAGAYVADHLPPNALVITSWESGSVRFYGHRTTLVWDALDPAWLDRAIAFARARGLEPYLLFERWEEPNFRQRFAGSSVAALDWPPFAEVGGQVRIYRPEDRDRYRRGEGVPTDYSR